MATLAQNQSNPFLLEFAGVPFVSDKASPARMRFRPSEAGVATPSTDQQPLSDLIDDLNRKIPFDRLEDFSLPTGFPGRNLSSLALSSRIGPNPSASVNIGEWYYPTGASRWSAFRGLATSQMAAAMIAAVTGSATVAGSAPAVTLMVASSTTITTTFASDPGLSVGDSVTVSGASPADYDGTFVVTGIPSLGVVQWQALTAPATSPATGTITVATSKGGFGAWLPGTFAMMVNPSSPDNPQNDASLYSLNSDMFMLPPRPLAEQANTVGGFYLITLVDERYWWKDRPITLTVNYATTWQSLITQITATLGITLTSSPIEAVWGQPEPDSQLWTCGESIAAVFDAVAANVGRTVVRNLDGTYALQTPAEAWAIATRNRNGSSGAPRQVVRNAGGDIFQSGGQLPIGPATLPPGRNAVVPSNVNVAFPYYVYADDPVPHFVNPRTTPQRPSAWFEDSFGLCFNVNVPVFSGGPFVSGIGGTSGVLSFRDTAKALVSGELAIGSGILGSGISTSGAFSSGSVVAPPLNASGLTALAMATAQSHWSRQVAVALDEVYPGTLAWTPEAAHDVAWTYSDKVRLATCRVLKTQWNNPVTSFQHGTPPVSLSGQFGVATTAPRGVGGPSVALSVRDSTSGLSQSGPIQAALAAPFMSGDLFAVLEAVDYLPTASRWRGQVGQEAVLFDGTSGGIVGSGVTFPVVTATYRGIDGTVQAPAVASGQPVTWTVPNANWGTNLIEVDPGNVVAPGAWTSGGIQGVRIGTPVQTLQVIDGAGTTINGTVHCSGAVYDYDVTQAAGSQFRFRSFAWAVERNAKPLTGSAGLFAEGQAVGTSATSPAGTTSPVYLVTAPNYNGNDPSGGPPNGADINFFRQCGGTERWYTADTGRVPTVASHNVAPDTIYAIPFVAPAGGLIDGIRCKVNSGTGGLIRLAIYKRVGFGGPGINDNLPGALLYDSADLSATVGTTPTATPNVSLVAGEQYWLAIVVSELMSLASLQDTDLFPFMGADGAGGDSGWGVAVTAAFAYGAMPSVFPPLELVTTGGATPYSVPNYVPMVMVHYKCPPFSGSGGSPGSGGSVSGSGGGGTVTSECCSVTNPDGSVTFIPIPASVAMTFQQSEPNGCGTSYVPQTVAMNWNPAIDVGLGGTVAGWVVTGVQSVYCFDPNGAKQLFTATFDYVVYCTAPGEPGSWACAWRYTGDTGTCVAASIGTWQFPPEIIRQSLGMSSCNPVFGTFLNPFWADLGLGTCHYIGGAFSFLSEL